MHGADSSISLKSEALWSEHLTESLYQADKRVSKGMESERRHNIVHLDDWLFLKSLPHRLRVTLGKVLIEIRFLVNEKKSMLTPSQKSSGGDCSRT